MAESKRQRELVPVGPDVVSMAECDAQLIGLVAGPLAGPSEASANDLESERDREEHVDSFTTAATSDSATADPDGTHVGVGARRSASSSATQTAQVDTAATPEGAHVDAGVRRSAGPPRTRPRPNRSGGHSRYPRRRSRGRGPAAKRQLRSPSPRGPLRPAQAGAWPQRCHARPSCRRHGLRRRRTPAAAGAAGPGLLRLAPSRLAPAAAGSLVDELVYVHCPATARWSVLAQKRLPAPTVSRSVGVASAPSGRS